MKKKARMRTPSTLFLGARVQTLTHDVEKLVVELKAVPLKQRDAVGQELLAPAARSLERAAKALCRVAEDGPPVADYSDLRAVLAGTSPLMSQLGSRVVLAGAGANAPSKPSSGAQALALLLEDPSRSVDAGALAKHLDCSVPMARTTLNRLVQSGHAIRAARGQFKAKG